MPFLLLLRTNDFSRISGFLPAAKPQMESLPVISQIVEGEPYSWALLIFIRHFRHVFQKMFCMETTSGHLWISPHEHFRPKDPNSSRIANFMSILGDIVIVLLTMFIAGSDSSKFHIVSFHPKYFVPLKKKSSLQKQYYLLIGKRGSYFLRRRLTFFQDMLF